ncbi:hypothetical protein K438DRAFT_1754488 [Mycena galopus ATCC 62051]|nr:hypothetical protein K438DRAFT_1754488 [Mycena galopus ATCC 62051]
MDFRASCVKRETGTSFPSHTGSYGNENGQASFPFPRSRMGTKTNRRTETKTDRRRFPSHGVVWERKRTGVRERKRTGVRKRKRTGVVSLPTGSYGNENGQASFPFPRSNVVRERKRTGSLPFPRGNVVRERKRTGSFDTRGTKNPSMNDGPVT